MEVPDFHPRSWTASGNPWSLEPRMKSKGTLLFLSRHFLGAWGLFGQGARKNSCPFEVWVCHLCLTNPDMSKTLVLLNKYPDMFFSHSNGYSQNWWFLLIKRYFLSNVPYMGVAMLISFKIASWEKAEKFTVQGTITYPTKREEENHHLQKCRLGLDIPPWKLTWHWKITIFNRKYIFNWWFFQEGTCYLEGAYLLFCSLYFTLPT